MTLAYKIFIYIAHISQISIYVNSSHAFRVHTIKHDFEMRYLFILHNQNESSADCTDIVTFP